MKCFSVCLRKKSLAYGTQQALVRVCDGEKKNLPDCSLTADCRFLQSIWRRDALRVQSVSLHIPSKTESTLTEGAALCHRPSVTQSAASVPRRPLLKPVPWCRCGSVRVNGMDGREDEHRSRSGLTSLHQLPQADHVRGHVPENADASHRPGWALQRSSGGTCMRTGEGDAATRVKAAFWRGGAETFPC